MRSLEVLYQTGYNRFYLTNTEHFYVFKIINMNTYQTFEVTLHEYLAMIIHCYYNEVVTGCTTCSSDGKDRGCTFLRNVSKTTRHHSPQDYDRCLHSCANLSSDNLNM
jgi:hypothetical protein